MACTKKCDDKRCLYLSKENPLPASFSEVTRKTREGEGLWEKCNHCNLVINRSGVDSNEVTEFHNSDYNEKNSHTQGEPLCARQHFEARLSTVTNIADHIRPYLKKDMRVLELGGATGELLSLIRDDVSYCYNNEINELYTRFSADELGLDGSWTNYFELDFPKQFDFVLSVNTIDHMYETGKAAEKIHMDLKPGGYAYIEVSNDHQALKTFLSEETRRKSQEVMYQKAHHYSFTKETLLQVVSQRGFEVMEIGTRHDYSIVNFLNWYFTGQRQMSLVEAKGPADLFGGDSGLERDMNQLLQETNVRFKEILNNHGRGELLTFLLRK